MSSIPDFVDKPLSSPLKGSYGFPSPTASGDQKNRNVRTVVQKTNTSNEAQSPRPKKPVGLSTTVTSSSSKSMGLSTTRTARSAPGTKPSQRRTLASTTTTKIASPKPQQSSQGTTTRATGMRAQSAQARYVDPNSGRSTPRAMSPIAHPPLSPASRGMHIPSQSPTAPNRLRIFSKHDYKGVQSAGSKSLDLSPGKKQKSKSVASPLGTTNNEEVTVVESVRVNTSQTPTKQQEPYKAVLTPSDPNEIIHAVYHQNRRGKRVVCMYLTKYSVLRLVAKRLGYVVEESLEFLERYSFYMCWSDTVLSLPALVRFSNWQRSNHFPSMYLLCRKGHLGATLTKLHNIDPVSYKFYPRTWLMRTQKETFRKVLKSKEASTKYFIMKPNSGCQGRGIVVTKNPFLTGRDLDHYIVQEYVSNPLLIEGRKFDLRVYVLLTSIREPSIFIFEDGLVRICTDPYEAPNESNIKNACKHLTNYAVNKRNPNFVFNTDVNRGDVGNKRNFKFFNGWLEKQGHSSKQFWERVGHVITKTVLAAQPQIANVYNSCFPIANEGYTCFEVLGFDILVDEKLKPWLLEVNHTPSFATDTPLDMDIKSRLLSEVWQIIDIQPADWEKDMLKEQYEYTRRSLPPWANNHPIYSKHLTVNAGNRRDPIVINPSQEPPASSANPSNPLEVPQYVINRRAQEDSKLRGFTRVYPSKNPTYEENYRRIRRSALKAWSQKGPELNPSSSPSASPTTKEPSPAFPVDPEPAETEEENKSMSRPMPTSEELKWLHHLQKKLDELSEQDPKEEDLKMEDE